MLHRPSLVEPSVPVDVVDADTVEAVFDDIAGHLNAQHGRLIDVTVWLLANKALWQGDGLYTPTQYLAWRCGVSPTTARNIVVAAERVAELPNAIDAIRCGELSLDQLMPIVRRVPAWADGQVVSLATRLTVPQIQRLIRDTDFDWQPGPEAVTDEPVADNTQVEATDSSEQHRHADEAGSPTETQNRVSYGYRDNGRWFLYADLDADLGELIETALDEARDAQFQQRNTNTDQATGQATGPHANSSMTGPAAERKVSEPVSDVDGLTELAQRSLDSITNTSRRNRYRINLHLDTNQRLTSEQGVAIPESIAQYLTCDGTLHPIFAENGLPISVGRSQRTIPDRTRRTVLKRDSRCCQVPGCTTSKHLDIHHIIHWSHNGPTDTYNLITLCARHHRMHHQHKLAITGNADQPDTLVFTNAVGRRIQQSGANPTPPAEPPAPIRGSWEHPYGEPLQSRWVTFTEPTLTSSTSPPRQHHQANIA